jgi:hypothetical protein
MLAHYRNGLHSDLHKEMLIARLINMDEAYQLALCIEKHVKVSSGRRMTSTDPRPGCMAPPPTPKTTIVV